MVRRTRLDIAAMALAALLAGNLRAEPPPAATPSSQIPPANGPCAGPLARFCKDVPAGEGRLRACLMAHEQELPASCRALLAGAAPAGARRSDPPMGPRQVRACRKDLATHCAGVPSGNERWLRCLRDHEAVVSSGCKAAIARPSAATTR